MSSQQTKAKKTEQPETSITIKVSQEKLPVGVMPPDFPEDYVVGAVTPFLLSSEFVGETPHLPMIDLALSKEKAVPVQLWGMLYKNWVPNPEEEGRSVFMQGYENRGPDNRRKRIYMSATTPDLIDQKYRPKIQLFYKRFLSDSNAGKPMMKHYFENYYDLYWNLHVGAMGDEIPDEVRQFSEGFNATLGFWYPTTEMVCKALMQARATREVLKAWLDKRVQKIMDGKQPDEDSTFVHYWLKNGQLGENFRRIDIVFECFHNFLAFSQWANMVYNVAAKLEPVHGDPAVRVRFDQVMKDPDASDGGAFTPLDRLVMELFRVISPNGGSFSTMARNRAMLGTAFSGIMTPHLPASMSPLHWQNPTEFDPDRFKSAPTTVDNDEAKAHQVGLARCPFSKASFPVKDGRKVTMTNSAFGAVYSEINGKAVPLVDTAGYAPFGFGYRRCAGEQLTVEFIKEFLRHVWKEKVSFSKLDIPVASKQPVNPGTVLNDDIAFNKAK